MSRRSLQAFIFRAPGVSASGKTVARLCAAWGLEYGRLSRPPHAVAQKRILARDVAVRQLRRALLAGHAIFCADESYCNVRESREFSFYAAGAPFATFARATGTGLGNRVCFTHALGEAGLAGAPADLEAVVGDIESARGALRKACFTRRARQKARATTTATLHTPHL